MATAPQTTSICDRLADWPDPRPKGRTRGCVLHAQDVRRVLRRALAAPHTPSVFGAHGGGVPNAYDYPAETTAVAVIAIADDAGTLLVSAGTDRMSAKGATVAGAVGVCVSAVGRNGPWWWLASGRTPKSATPDDYRLAMQAPETLRYARLGGDVGWVITDRDGHAETILRVEP